MGLCSGKNEIGGDPYELWLGGWEASASRAGLSVGRAAVGWWAGEWGRSAEGWWAVSGAGLSWAGCICRTAVSRAALGRYVGSLQAGPWHCAACRP